MEIEMNEVRKKADMKKAVIVALVALGFVALATYCVDVTRDKDALSATLECVQSELATTRTELLSTQNTLATTQGTLATTEATLAVTQGALTATENTLVATQTELLSTRGELVATRGTLNTTEVVLATTQADLLSTRNDLVVAETTLASTLSTLATAQQQLSEVAQELGVAQETLAGLGVTIYASGQNYDVNLVDNPDATNPSWSELLDFLSDDQTENNEYVEDVYDCSEFSRDVHNNAEAVGIRSAVVHVSFSNVFPFFGHAVNAFLTTDYGLVYVDCAGPPDTVARVESGEEYRAVEVGTISPGNVRNGSWWDGLTSYFYVCSGVYEWDGYQFWCTGAVTSSIGIFW